MESEKNAACIQLLEYVKLVLCPLWQPEEVTTDFEKSLSKAVKQVFPASKLIGCYFHFNQVGDDACSLKFSFYVYFSFSLLSLRLKYRVRSPISDQISEMLSFYP
jgi:hypothetical protein